LKHAGAIDDPKLGGRNQKMNLRTCRSQEQEIKSTKKDTVMKIKNNLLTKISLCLGLAAVLAFASGCSTSSGGGMQPMSGSEHQQMSK